MTERKGGEIPAAHPRPRGVTHGKGCRPAPRARRFRETGRDFLAPAGPWGKASPPPPRAPILPPRADRPTAAAGQAAGRKPPFIARICASTRAAAGLSAQ